MTDDDVVILYSENLVIRNGAVKLSRRPTGASNLAVYMLNEDGSVGRQIRNVLWTEDVLDFGVKLLFGDDVPNGSTVAVSYTTTVRGREYLFHAEDYPEGREIALNEPISGEELDVFIGDSDGPKFDDFAEVLS